MAIKSNATSTFFKLAGTKVSSVRLEMAVQVDKAKNLPLYNSINTDEAIIPSGYIVSLIDGTTIKTALGNGKSVFSKCIQLNAPAAPAP